MSNDKPTASWKPGESGNPNGRPKKGTTFTDIIKSYMDESHTLENGDIISNKELLIRKLTGLALKDGDLNAVKLLLQYHDGMPKQAVKMDVVRERSRIVEELEALNIVNNND